MLQYIIDGWNLIHKIPSIKNSSTPKKDFVFYIKKHKITGSKNNKVLIVFDGKIDLDFIKSEHQFRARRRRCSDLLIWLQPYC